MCGVSLDDISPESKRLSSARTPLQKKKRSGLRRLPRTLIYHITMANYSMSNLFGGAIVVDLPNGYIDVR